MQHRILIAGFVAFAVMCGGLWSLAVWQDLDATLDRAELGITATAQLMEVNSTRVIEAGDALTLAMVEQLSDWDFQDHDEGRRIWRNLAHQMQATPLISSFWVLDAEGRNRMENWGYRAEVKPDSFSHRAYFQAHVHGERGLYLDPMELGTVSGKRRFVLSRAVRGDDGELRAVAVVGVYSDAFARPFEDAALGMSGHYHLVTLGGRHLAHWPPDSEIGHVHSDLLHDMGPDGTTVVRSNIFSSDGAMIAARQLQSFPAAVIAEVGTAVALEPWLRRCLLSGAIVAGALFGFAILMGIGLRIAASETAARRQLATVNRALDERVRERTAELRLALRKAEAADGIKAKFLATISHDLRQPLQGLSLFIDLVMARTSDEQLRRLGVMTLASVQAGRRLLDDLVDLSQLESGVVRVEPTAVPLAPLLARLAAEAMPAARAKGLRLRVVPTRLVVRSDPVRLQQIIQNLLTNAIKYTERGTVLLGCRRVSGQVGGDQVRVELWDTGPGIPLDHLQLIFEEFYQVANPERNSAHGVGLGLAIVDRTARLLGHPLVVRSEAGKGSMFGVVLPRAPDPEADREQELCALAG